MTLKGQARGPNHFIDPEEIKPGLPTGVEVTRATNTHVGTGASNRWKRVAAALLHDLGEWHMITTYPPVIGKDMVTVAQHTVDRLHRCGGKQEYQMTIVTRYIHRVIGPDAFVNWHVEAKMFQQPDRSIEIWARYTERVAA
jgi:hypothetical protein